MIRPMTIVQKPEVKVCMAPPRAKTTAPLKSVPRLPMMSPTCPAATEVTAYTIRTPREVVVQDASSELTEGADFEHCYHRPNLNSSRVIEVFSEVWAGDDTRHYTEHGHTARVRRHGLDRRAHARKLTPDHIRTWV